MKILIPAILIVILFQSCGGSEFDVASLPDRPMLVGDMISVEGVDIIEGQSAAIIITPKFNITRAYSFNWEIVPQGSANLADILTDSGEIQIGPGSTPVELPITSINNIQVDGTRRFVIEFTFVSDNGIFKTSAEIFLRDND